MPVHREGFPCRCVSARENAETGTVQVGQFLERLLVNGVKKPAHEVEGVVFPHLSTGRDKKAAPESFGRSLLAAAQERPVYPSFIILRAGQSKGHQRDIALMA